MFAYQMENGLLSTILTMDFGSMIYQEVDVIFEFLEQRGEGRYFHDLGLPETTVRNLP